MNHGLLRFASLVPALSVAVALAQPQYTVTDIGPFDLDAISQSGMVAGETGYGAVAWDAQHGLTPIPGLSYAQAFKAEDVNALGQVVGYDDLVEGQTATRMAYVWDRAGGTRPVGDFGRFPNGRRISSEAYGTNDLGQIVGYYQDENARWLNAFKYTPGAGWVSLPRLHPEHGVHARKINNAGQVIGYSHGSQYLGTPILWQPDGSIIELGHLLNQYQNFLEDINELGYICGGTFGPLGNASYIRSPDGTYRRLLNPNNPTWWTFAAALNNHGMIVGSGYEDNESAALMWSKNGDIFRLRELLDDSGAGWQLLDADGINDSGQIAGTGRFNGQVRGFLLTPVPEPASVVALTLGLTWLASRWSRKSLRN